MSAMLTISVQKTFHVLEAVGVGVWLAHLSRAWLFTGDWPRAFADSAHAVVVLCCVALALWFNSKTCQ